MRIKSVEEFNELCASYPLLDAQFRTALVEQQWDLAETTRKQLNKQFEAMKKFRRQYDYPRRCYGSEVLVPLAITE